MSIKVSNNEILLSGNLNEQFDMAEVKSCIEVNKTNFAHSLTLNFKDVPRANSCGIANLLKMMTALELQSPLKLAHCPAWLVDQFNQIDEFFQVPLSITSVYAPYMDPESHDYTMRLIELYDGFFESTDFQNIETFVNSTGQSLAADFDKDDYFSFSANLKKKAS